MPDENDLTMRDRFAMAALSSLMASPTVSCFTAKTNPGMPIDVSLDSLAVSAYQVADALLAVRDGAPPPTDKTAGGE